MAWRNISEKKNGLFVSVEYLNKTQDDLVYKQLDDLPMTNLSRVN